MSIKYLVNMSKTSHSCVKHCLANQCLVDTGLTSDLSIMRHKIDN